MQYQCELQQLRAQPALSIRLTTAVRDLPLALGQGYGSIAQYLREQNEQPAGSPYAIYYNMDMQNLDVELGFPVSHYVNGKDRIKARETPTGSAATCVHVGPYSSLAPAYTALTQWITLNGFEPTGIAFEVYLNDPNETLPTQLQTQIYLFVNAD